MRGSVLVLLLLFLAGCNGKGGDAAGFETPAKEGEFYVIHLTPARAFDPEQAQVPAGALVSFAFGIDCDVHSETPGGPDSTTGRYANGIYPEGERYNWAAPSEAREFDVYCSRHADMTGTIRVG